MCGGLLYNPLLWKLNVIVLSLIDNGSVDKREQLNRILNLCELLNLIQVNQKWEIIGLLFTSDMALFSDLKVNKTSISDLDIMEISTTYILKSVFIVHGGGRRIHPRKLQNCPPKY